MGARMAGTRNDADDTLFKALDGLRQGIGTEKLEPDYKPSRRVLCSENWGFYLKN